jgi:cold-inducible RNA-binding protein
MGKKLYVGNLSYDTTDSALEQMFAAFGTVASAQVIMDRDTGRSKGFGFVEMSNDQEAQAAIAGLSGKMVGGRSLTVNEAKPKEDRGGGGGRGGYGGGGGGRGGGGGGYGGGGGAGGDFEGAAGGSSFMAAGATDVTSSASSRAGDGQVTITFDAATDTCPSPPPPGVTPTPGAAVPVLAVARFTG